MGGRGEISDQPSSPKQVIENGEPFGESQGDQVSKTMSAIERLRRTRFGCLRETGKEPEKLLVTQEEMDELVNEFSAWRYCDGPPPKIISHMWDIPLEVIKYVPTL